MPESVPSVCRHLKDEVDILDQVYQDLSSQLDSAASPAERRVLIAEMRYNREEPRTKHQELTTCIEQNPQPSRPRPDPVPQPYDLDPRPGRYIFR